MRTRGFFATIVLIVLLLLPAGASAAPALVLAPGAFGKTTPANGASIPGLHTTLSWGTSTDATDYQFCYGLTSTNPCDGNWISTSGATTAQLDGLIGLTTYYWQVRASNTGGTTFADGDETAVWSFTTQNLLQLTFRSAKAQDGWILESSETSGRGGSINASLATLNVGDDKSRKQYRAILSFDTSLLPAASDGILNSVTLKIKKAGTSGTNPFATLGNLVVDVKKGAIGPTGALQTADFNAAVGKSGVLTFSNKLVGGWFVKSINSLNFKYINRDGVTQFRLHFAKDDDNDGVADFLKLYSGNAGSASQPVLVIEYFAP